MMMMRVMCLSIDYNDADDQDDDSEGNTRVMCVSVMIPDSQRAG